MENDKNEVATRESWKTSPIVTPHEIKIELVFSQEQYEKIKKGLIPQEMEDKWFIFFEDNWLYFHRSWTGLGIYKAEIKENNGKYCINEFFVERDAEIYGNGDDNEDIDDFAFLIAWGLLNVDVRDIFFRKKGDSKKETMKSWSTFGSLMVSKDDIEQYNFVKKNYIIGAIAGDIIGSVYEWHNVKTLDFDLFSDETKFTDDSVLTLATMHSLLHDTHYGMGYYTFGRKYPGRGYGQSFHAWLRSNNPEPYNSYGNGSAMRVSPVGWYGNSIEEVMTEAQKSAEVTHNHPEGIKGAQATAVAVYMARVGKGKDEIKNFITETFHYDLDRKIDDIRPVYQYDVTCQGSVPEAIIAFLESTDFENAIRLAISIGGDSDTIACITGGIAEAFYKSIPDYIIDNVIKLLPDELVGIIKKFSILYKKFPMGIV